MTADTVAACEVTRESALALAEQLAFELVPAGMRSVARGTEEPFITLELVSGPSGSRVTHQRQVSRQCDRRTLERGIRAAWVELVAKHREPG